MWFRQDLRLADNPAFRAAAGRGLPVIPVYFLGEGDEGLWAPGGASRWWLQRSLAALERRLSGLGSRLILRRGNPAEELPRLVKETSARAVFWNRRYEPAARRQEGRVARVLEDFGVRGESFNSALLAEPGDLVTTEGGPFQVFTPFWKALQRRGEPEPPRPAPRSVAQPGTWPLSLSPAELLPDPPVDWAQGLRGAWEPGESGAARRLKTFLDQALAGYPAGRDRPDLPGISFLSPHLHFGEIGPRQVWLAVRRRESSGRQPGLARAAEAFCRQLAWREFSHHLLFFFPHTPEEPLRPAFAGFPWGADAAAFKAWRKGLTGYPIVDAGMRQLWSSGFMHNRVRMLAASFLVKDLLLSWVEGARWFWDTLVDADLANNTMGWQWTAGCGADAAPYFRVFNPVTQGKKFDPHGEYVRRFVPELARLPDSFIHCPWAAPPSALEQAGVILGKSYPRPLVDHAWARERALGAFSTLKKILPKQE